MFKNLKIGVRLGLGFGLVILFLIAVSLLSFIRVGFLSNEVSDLVDDKYKKTVVATDIIRAMNQVAQINRNTVIITDPVELEKQRNRREAERKIISERIDELEKTVNSEQGKRLLSVMSDKRVDYVAALDKFSDLNKSGDREGAIKMLYGEFRPITDAYLGAIRELVT